MQRALDKHAIALLEKLGQRFTTFAPNDNVHPFRSFATNLVFVKVRLAARDPNVETCLTSLRKTQIWICAKIPEQQNPVESFAHVAPCARTSRETLFLIIIAFAYRSQGIAATTLPVSSNVCALRRAMRSHACVSSVRHRRGT